VVSSHSWRQVPCLLGGRTFSSDKQPGAQGLPFAALFPRASDSLFPPSQRSPQPLSRFASPAGQVRPLQS